MTSPSAARALGEEFLEHYGVGCDDVTTVGVTEARRVVTALLEALRKERPANLQCFIAFVGEGHVNFPKTLTELSDAVGLFECVEEDCTDSDPPAAGLREMKERA